MDIENLDTKHVGYNAKEGIKAYYKIHNEILVNRKDSISYILHPIN